MNKSRSDKQYGGFLPLELNLGHEYHSEFRDIRLRFNSVKASLYCVIKKINPQKLYIPYYYCPSTTESLKKICAIKFYHINEQLNPIDLIDNQDIDKEDNVILLVDYFGIRYAEIVKVLSLIKNASVILDLAHDFYADPVIAEKVYNIYSAKKFFGVPDGSYLIAKEVSRDDCTNQMPSLSTEYNQYLLTAYEQGTNIAYKDKKLSDKIIASNYAGMSVLALGLLKNVNYERTRIARINNFKMLHSEMQQINMLEFEDDVEYPAYHYPLMFKKGQEALANHIKKSLITEHIYTPTLWYGIDLFEYGTDDERQLSSRIIFLPIDQRYVSEDMKYISERIKGHIDEYS